MGLEYLWILLLVSAIICTVGFYKYVYFISIGYGFAVAGIGVTLAVMSINGTFQAGVFHYLFFLLLLIYGVRLSVFLAIREAKNVLYRKTLQEVTSDESKMPVFVKAAIWVCVSSLYVGQTSPVFFRIYNGGKTSAIAWVALAISTVGFLMEMEADRQKSIQKRSRPDMVAMKGLYKMVRCPNYLGEILFWTGVFVSGLDIFSGWGQFLMAIISYICIVYVMFDGAKRLEKRQMKRYGSEVEYNTYADKTPIIIPLLPIYHLNKKTEKKSRDRDAD